MDWIPMRWELEGADHAGVAPLQIVRICRPLRADVFEIQKGRLRFNRDMAWEWEPQFPERDRAYQERCWFGSAEEAMAFFAGEAVEVVATEQGDEHEQEA